MPPKVAEGFLLVLGNWMLDTPILILLLAFVPFDTAILIGGAVAGPLGLAGLIEAHHRHDRDGRPVRERVAASGPQRRATPQSVQLLEGATPTRTTGSTLGHRRPVRGALAGLRPPLRGERCAHTARTRPLNGALPINLRRPRWDHERA